MPTEQMVARLRRAFMLDQTAFEEIRDDAVFTPTAAGLAAAAILIAGFGAWLWGETVLDFTPDGFFVDTFILGSIFTALLWLAGVAVIYLFVTQVYRVTASPDAVFRVSAVGFLPYALGILVFIPEVGFGLALLSIFLAFYLTMFGLSAAFRIGHGRALVAAAVGLAVLAIILPLIEEFPNDNFATGIFVYGLGA